MDTLAVKVPSTYYYGYQSVIGANGSIRQMPQSQMGILDGAMSPIPSSIAASCTQTYATNQIAYFAPSGPASAHFI